jgi:hypothetical protein
MDDSLQLSYLKDVVKTVLLPVYKNYCLTQGVSPELDLDWMFQKKPVCALLSGSFGVSSDRREPRNKKQPTR